ncbi:helix-turn-helix domain-containing protein [Phaeobacter piscinae]|uniref:helix-turn-helix domain-containing protein n=1 Tax=Phaeobacter piscinae TaxID=1580596 RepID=UPI00058F6F72|nr:helix-turn-helix domain-containing protein [Phaeobacter piscinae]UTS79540.1 hypothetical protein OL67_000587 [Phaeobacter piscinae]
MGKLGENFEIAPSEAMSADKPIGSAIGSALVRPEMWLSMSDLMTLADIKQASASEAIKKGKWRGADLAVRMVAAGRGGAGGKVPQVHADTLPADLREAWYLQHGIELHEKVDAITGKTVMVPDQKYQPDAKYQKALSIARWRLDVIQPALNHASGSPERAAAVSEIADVARLLPSGKRKKLTAATVYNWIKAYEAEKLSGLIRKTRADTGEKRKTVSRAWDAFFERHIDEATHARVSDELTAHIQSLWASGERGWRTITEKSTTKLIEISRDLKVIDFEALPLGRSGDKASTKTQFGVCCVSRRLVERDRDLKLIAIQDKDNAVFQDYYVPSIRRNYNSLLPRQIVVGDVHPVDIMMRREDGTVVYPKAIAWYDVATNEIHMTFVLCEPGEGIRREHVAQSFEAMVDEWGLPQLLYLDNGSEYSWDDMIDGFTELSQVSKGGMKVADLDGDPEVNKRVMEQGKAIVRSLPYNAKGKPGIEGAFGNIEQVFFATIEGWTAGDRMNKKTHAKGKDPIAFKGNARDFLEIAGKALEWYHKRPQQGAKMRGKSPNEALRGFIENGWGKAVLSSPEVMALAFSNEVQRTPDRGRISYTPRRGETMYFYADELLGIDHEITVKVPAFNPEFVFCLVDGEIICQAFPEQTYGVLDSEGAYELNRRKKAFRRQIAEKRKHVALLSLTEETERHIAHMPDAPEAPVNAIVDAGIIDRMARMQGESRKALLDEAENKKPKGPVEQWKTGPNEVLAGFQFAEDEE